MVCCAKAVVCCEYRHRLDRLTQISQGTGSFCLRFGGSIGYPSFSWLRKQALQICNMPQRFVRRSYLE